MKLKPALIALLYMALIFALSSTPMDTTTDPNILREALLNLAHIPLFGILAYLWMRAFTGNNVGLKKAIMYSIIITIVYAVFDEFHQSFVPGRDASLGDIGLDTLGCIGALFIYRKFVPVSSRHYAQPIEQTGTEETQNRPRCQL